MLFDPRDFLGRQILRQIRLRCGARNITADHPVAVGKLRQQGLMAREKCRIIDDSLRKGLLFADGPRVS